MHKQAIIDAIAVVLRLFLHTTTIDFRLSPSFAMDSLSPQKPSKMKSLGVVAVIALLFLVFILDVQRRAAVDQLEQLSVKLDQLTGGNQTQNQEAARLIVDRVRKLYSLPTDVEPTVATIVDVVELRKRNSFYNKAKNGDYLIVTNDRAILFDAEADVIVDVVPVQIQPAAEGEQAAQ